MKTKTSILLLFVVLLNVEKASGKYGFPAMAEVPIDRLVANLKKASSSGTNQIQQNYWIARVHSLAYAIQLDSMKAATNDFEPFFGIPDGDLGIPLEIRKPDTEEALIKVRTHLTNAVHHYEVALKLLKKESNPDRHRWIILPLNLGHAWCLEQSGERRKAIDAYRETFEIAWDIEVVGEVNWKEWFTERWDDIKAKKNPVHFQRNKSINARPCFTEESFKCLFRLLDPVADKKEVAELKELETEFKAIPRSFWITPILVPLKPAMEFSELVDADAGVRFNLDGLHPERRWGWITANAAWLVYDHRGEGSITSGRQLFGNVTFWIFWENGYQPLAALDDDRNGRLEGEELHGLSLWQDQDSDGFSDPGEVKPVGEFGIQAIATGHSLHAEGVMWNPSGVELMDGTHLPSYDWIVPGQRENTVMGVQ